jgi:type II secretory pathway component PulK
MRLQAVNQSRQGAAIIWAIAAMSVTTILTTAITSQILAGRRLAERRQDQLQALWLARSGLEMAIDKLIANPHSYTGEVLTPIPDSQLRIEVKSFKDSKETYQITCIGRCVLEDARSVTRSLTRQVKRVTANGQVRIEVLPESDTRLTNP